MPVPFIRLFSQQYSNFDLYIKKRRRSNGPVEQDEFYLLVAAADISTIHYTTTHMKLF
jgi:hypothetical protein